MKKKPRKKVVTVTIKVTEQTVKNLNVASALSGKTQYEVAEEGSQFVAGKYTYGGKIHKYGAKKVQENDSSSSDS